MKTQVSIIHHTDGRDLQHDTDAILAALTHHYNLRANEVISSTENLLLSEPSANPGAEIAVAFAEKQLNCSIDLSMKVCWLSLIHITQNFQDVIFNSLFVNYMTRSV
jgi:hypothetical protein